MQFSAHHHESKKLRLIEVNLRTKKTCFGGKIPLCFPFLYQESFLLLLCSSQTLPLPRNRRRAASTAVDGQQQQQGQGRSAGRAGSELLDRAASEAYAQDRGDVLGGKRLRRRSRPRSEANSRSELNDDLNDDVTLEEELDFDQRRISRLSSTSG